jgi:hypothetical protein
MRKGIKLQSVSKTFLGSFALMVTSALHADKHNDNNRTTHNSYVL